MSITLADAEVAIKNQLPFRMRDTFSAGPIALGYGELPDQYHEDVNVAVYVVFSYGTPIGWIREDGTKTVPDVGYSATTSQHQYIVLNAWGIKGQFPKRGRTVRRAGGGPRRGGIDG